MKTAARVKPSATVNKKPRLAVPGWLDNARLPNDARVVSVLNNTARAAGVASSKALP